MAANTPRWAGKLALTETPDSGNLVLGERTMLKRVFEGTYVNCLNSVIARGTFGTGTMLGWVVTSCEVASFRGARGRLTVSWEPGGAFATMPLPCPDFSLESIELYPRTERHWLFNQTSTGVSDLADITIEMVSLVYAAVHGATKEARAAARAQVYAYPDSDQSDLGVVLLDKLRKGEETYYLAGQKYSWWYFSYTPPPLSLGGIIMPPDGPGALPTALPPGLSWLRLADSMAPVGVNGSQFKVTKTFMGGPAGHWDSDLYS
jgi:hypothetical protein